MSQTPQTSQELQGKKIAFLVANEGVEQVELVSPREAVEAAGGTAVLIATEKAKVQCFEHLDKGEAFDADLATADANPDDYDGIVLPGGVANPDQLRTDQAALEFVKKFAASGKPIAAICHAPWTLVEAGLVKGKTLTSWPSLQTDIRNAGGEWRDEQVVRDDGNGFTLVTSRKPDDLDAFDSALVEIFAG